MLTEKSWLADDRTAMYMDTERCVRAVQAKDTRFDGVSFTVVVTTRIYCRPGRPVVPPKPQNMRFLPSAAACQQAGFRACKRCRPDTTPGSPQWNQSADLTARAMRLIGDGVVDREGVPGLARRLGTASGRSSASSAPNWVQVRSPSPAPSGPRPRDC